MARDKPTDENKKSGSLPPPPPPPPAVKKITNSDSKATKKMQRGMGEFGEGIGDFFRNLIDLREGLDKEGTIVNIKNNKRMKGANAWLLMCSILIASLGLDLDSPAVIIGAMLISPLMSPILGVGLAIGINDKQTLLISLQHFGIAIGIALFTSTLYFLITPYGEITPEISARTQPTLLDAAVAFVGGIAGIISSSRKDKSNAIPGVAIATALMPPLCVTGFGLANLLLYGVEQSTFSTLTNLNYWEILLNSFYLFFLNAVLVATATFMIVRFLQFPIQSFVDPAEQRRTNLVILGFGLLMIIPSYFIMRGVIDNIRQNQDIKRALNDTFDITQRRYIDGWTKIPKDDDQFDLLIKVYGPGFKRPLKDYEEVLSSKLEHVDLIEIVPTSEINLDKFQNVEAQVSQVSRLDSILQQMVTAPKKKKAEEIVRLENRIAQLTSDSLIQKAVQEEILALWPDHITEVSYVPTNPNAGSTGAPILAVRWKTDSKTTRNKKDIQDRMKRYVEAKVGKEIRFSVLE